GDGGLDVRARAGAALGRDGDDGDDGDGLLVGRGVEGAPEREVGGDVFGDGHLVVASGEEGEGGEREGGERAAAHAVRQGVGGRGTSVRRQLEPEDGDDRELVHALEREDVVGEEVAAVVGVHDADEAGEGGRAEAERPLDGEV